MSIGGFVWSGRVAVVRGRPKWEDTGIANTRFAKYLVGSRESLKKLGQASLFSQVVTRLVGRLTMGSL